MRVAKQLGFISGAVLFAALGLSGVGQAAPLSNAAAGLSELQASANIDARMEKAHYTGHPHHHHYHHHMHHHHHHRAAK